MFEVNGTLVIFVLSFLVFIYLLNEIMLKPVGKTLEMRAYKIQSDLESAKASRHQAEQVLDKYEQDLKHIRSEAQGLINTAIEESNQTRQGDLAKVAAEGKSLLDKSKAALSAERASLIDSLVAQERELIETITRKVLNDETVKVSVDDTEVRRTLEEAC